MTHLTRKRKFSNVSPEETELLPPRASHALLLENHEGPLTESGSCPDESPFSNFDAPVNQSAQLLFENSSIPVDRRRNGLPQTDLSISTVPVPLLDSATCSDTALLPMLFEVCYGMITDVLVAPTTLNKSETPLNDQNGDESYWPVGFKSETAVLLNEKSEVVGQLNIAHSSALHELKERIPSLRCEVFLLPPEVHSAERSWSTETFRAVVSIYGDKNYRDIAGEELDRRDIFLQEPLFPDKLIPYSNPHVYSTADDGSTPYFTSQQEQVHRRFDDVITSVLNESVPYDQDFDFVQDGRIKTSLKQHQIAAIKFAQSREVTSVTRDTLTLWRQIGTSLGLQYRHSLTGVLESKPSNECRGGLLADEMGMGKSLSMLALIVHSLAEADEFANTPHTNHIDSVSQPTRATLIVTPKSTIEGWVNEIQRHLRNVEFVVYHGSHKDRVIPELERAEIVLTTYETVSYARTSADNPLASYKWFRIILDEAHHIRNMSTQMFSAIHHLHAQRRWCLTGTPVQNDLDDIFALTTFLRFSPFSTRKDIKAYITNPLSRYDQQGLDNLQSMMRVCSIRRGKKGLDLPTITFQERAVTLSEVERKQYQFVMASLLKELGKAARKESKRTSAITLRGIQKLRQICCHGLSQLDESDHKSQDETQHALTTCSNCAADLNAVSQPTTVQLRCGHQICDDCLMSSEKVSEGIDDNTTTPCLLCDQLENHTLLDEDGQKLLPSLTPTSDHDAQASARTPVASKINAVVNLLSELHQDEVNIHSDATKSLVFSYWIRALNAVETALKLTGIHYIRIDGQKTLEQRQQAIAEFRNNPNCRIALMTFGTGSVGLNLTAATHVHLVEPHWNPMVEEQAVARAHRIGQTKAVTVYRYIVQDSIEERIRNKQRKKLHMASLAGMRDEHARAFDSARKSVNDLDEILEKWHLV